MLAGEITSTANMDYIKVARDAIKRIGYDNTDTASTTKVVLCSFITTNSPLILPKRLMVHMMIHSIKALANKALCLVMRVMKHHNSCHFRFGYLTASWNVNHNSVKMAVRHGYVPMLNRK